MRKLINVGFVLAILLVAQSAYSNTVLLPTTDKSSKITTITFKDAKKGSSLTIKDSDGYILYEEEIVNSGSYSKKVDLSNLPDAVYFVELENETEIEVLSFLIKSNTVVFNTEASYIISKPQITIEEDKVYISNISENNKPAKIKVVYEGLDVAYSEKLKEPENLIRVYDFTGSLKGKYVISVCREGRIFSKSFNLKENE